MAKKVTVTFTQTSGTRLLFLSYLRSSRTSGQKGVAMALQDVLKSSRSLNTQESSQILRTLAGYLQSKGGSGVKATVVSNLGTVELSSDKLSVQRTFSKLSELRYRESRYCPCVCDPSTWGVSQAVEEQKDEPWTCRQCKLSEL